MSHVAEMQLEVMDLDSLDQACVILGIELVRGQEKYKWWGHSVGDYPIPAGFKASDLGKCAHAIRIPDNKNAYEIGVCPKKDGKPGYALLWDFYGGGYGMQEKVGNNGILLKQAYTMARSAKELKKKGYRTLIKKKQNGTMRMETY
jgi:hypothetical protein